MKIILFLLVFSVFGFPQNESDAIVQSEITIFTEDSTYTITSPVFMGIGEQPYVILGFDDNKSMKFIYLRVKRSKSFPQYWWERPAGKQNTTSQKTLDNGS